MINEPPKARWLRRLWRVAGSRPKVDRFLSSFLTHRKFLPECDPQEVIPGFVETEIKIKQCPMGAWSTPLVDVFVVLKAAIGFQSKRILELGSYRGDTARLLAENTGPDTKIVTVDVEPKHGAAYRGLDIERKIQRKVGSISRALFEKDEKYDFIFVDANHDFNSVMNDTKVAFEVLAEEGVILWHDYCLDSYFHGRCGVPEALNEYAKQYPIVAIRGTWVGIYSTVPGWKTATRSIGKTASVPSSVWDEQAIRG